MTNSTAAQERPVKVSSNDGLVEYPAGRERRSMLATGRALLATCIPIFLVCQTVSQPLGFAGRDRRYTGD